MSTVKQIDYYKLDTLDSKLLQGCLSEAVLNVDRAVAEIRQANTSSLDELALCIFSDKTITDCLLLLARLPVFSKDFEELFAQNLDQLQILNKVCK